MKRTKWFERKFSSIDDNGLLPSILERLAGTPARVEELTSSILMEMLERKSDESWSIKEEIGHLSDLEPLWAGRIDDFLHHEPVLRATDITNRKTHEANHNATDLLILQSAFRQQRTDFVDRIRHIPEELLLRSALHPRLQTPMRIIELAYFVAEHDDHHLARMREIITNVKSAT